MIKELNIVGDRMEGKTTALISLTVVNALQDPGSRTLFVTHNDGAALNAINEMSNRLNLFQDVTRMNKNVITLGNGSMIAAISYNAKPGHGQQVDYVIIDNVDFMPTDARLGIYVILPTAKSVVTASIKPFSITGDKNEQ